VLELLADVTEQPIQRPMKAGKRKSFYSGKKKRHTRKVEIVMESTGRIVSLSKSFPGRRHDCYLRKTEKPLPRNAQKWVDSGYQGLQKRTSFVWLPIKRKKKQPLTAEQKAYNRQHAAFHTRVEHKIRALKVFKILSNTYRNFGKKHHLRYNIISGLLNPHFAEGLLCMLLLVYIL
jgi:DDE superfamily endonuclease